MATQDNYPTADLQRLVIEVSSDDDDDDDDDNIHASSEDTSSEDSSEDGSDEDTSSSEGEDENEHPEELDFLQQNNVEAPINNRTPIFDQHAQTTSAVQDTLDDAIPRGWTATRIDPMGNLVDLAVDQNLHLENQRKSIQTSQHCLEQVLEVFPDISHAFVNDMYERRVVLATQPDISAGIIQRIAEMEKYPTHRSQIAKEKENAKALQAKLDSEARLLSSTKQFQQLSLELLKPAFPDITVAHIKATMMQHDRLRDSYLALSEASDSNLLIGQRLSKRRRESECVEPPHARYPPAMIALAMKELTAGRQERQTRSETRQIELAELHREREAQANGQISECGCCYADDVPIWKMGQCSGDIPHSFCFDCIRRLAESELGLGRCHPSCMDMSGCKARFAEQQLQLCLDEKSLARLIRLQQQEDLKAAGIEGLEDCPFCDYRAVCCSPLIDREFRCQNEECMKVSCRLCLKETHIPVSCEQAAKDRSLGARHQVEEAMTDALVRSCNKCKQRFIKTEGCNKMSCPACDHKQCYVCHKSIDSYDHFGERRSSKCPLYDHEGVESRHIREVKAAEESVKASIITENPDISNEELNIKVSESIKQAESAKQTEAAARHRRVVHHHHAPRIRHRRVNLPDAHGDVMFPPHIQGPPRPGVMLPPFHFAVAQPPQYPAMPPQDGHGQYHWQQRQHQQQIQHHEPVQDQLQQQQEQQPHQQQQQQVVHALDGLNGQWNNDHGTFDEFIDWQGPNENVNNAAATAAPPLQGYHNGMQPPQQHQQQLQQHPDNDFVLPPPLELGHPVHPPAYAGPGPNAPPPHNFNQLPPILELPPYLNQQHGGINVFPGILEHDQAFQPRLFQDDPEMHHRWEQIQQTIQARQQAMQQQYQRVQQQQQAMWMVQAMQQRQQQALRQQQTMRQQLARQHHQAAMQQQAIQQQPAWMELQQDQQLNLPAGLQNENNDNDEDNEPDDNADRANVF